MDFQSSYSKSFRGSDLDCKDPSLAQQHFKDEVDINVMLERYNATGVIPQGVSIPRYGDFTGISDYRSAADVVRRANESFMDVPMDIRRRFQNDPALFSEFCLDPKNLPELRKLGLAPEAISRGIGGVAPDGDKPEASKVS